MRAWICKEEGELIIGRIWYLIDCSVCKKESGRISWDLQTHGLCSNSITGFLHNKKARPLFGLIKVEIPGRRYYSSGWEQSSGNVDQVFKQEIRMRKQNLESSREK